MSSRIVLGFGALFVLGCVTLLVDAIGACFGPADLVAATVVDRSYEGSRSWSSFDGKRTSFHHQGERWHVIVRLDSGEVERVNGSAETWAACAPGVALTVDAHTGPLHLVRWWTIENVHAPNAVPTGVEE